VIGGGYKVELQHDHRDCSLSASKGNDARRREDPLREIGAIETPVIVDNAQK
jgi:hypothetical protein